MGRRIPATLDLASTLYSGQAFRWRPLPGGWHEGFIDNHHVQLRTIQGGLEWKAESGLGETSLKAYLRLDDAHGRFLRDVRKDAALQAALDAFPGLRLLAQDPWEVFVGYIVSANSNIGKIQRTLEALCRLAGEPVDGPSGTRHRFPAPADLARLTEDSLRSTGMGYRAPHLRAAASEVAEGRLDLHRLRRMTYGDAHSLLVETPGVADKVADCIQLYGMGHMQAFPVDVWISRVIRESYFPRKRLNYGAIRAWSNAWFGPWAGYAQHFLFHYRRVVGRFPRVAMSQPRRKREAASSSSIRARATRGVGGKTTSS